MARRNHNEDKMVEFFTENYDGDFETVQAMALDVIEQGRAVYNYPNNLRNIPNEVERLADHFKGLPAPFHPLYVYVEIEEQLKEWGVLKADAVPSTVRRMSDSYWSYWSKWIFDRAGVKPE